MKQIVVPDKGILGFEYMWSKTKKIALGVQGNFP